MNTKAKGARNERKIRDILLSYNWYVTKAGASLGLWDLVAINPTIGDVMLIQVKTNRPPPAREMTALKAFADSVRKHKHFSCWLVVVKDRKSNCWQRL